MLFNKLKEFADSVIINYNLNNSNYVGINLIEKDEDQKGKHMTLEKIATMLVEFKDDVNNKFNDLNNKVNDLNNKFNDLNNKVDNGFKEVNSKIDILEKDVKNLKNDVSLIMSCPTIKKEISQI